LISFTVSSSCARLHTFLHNRVFFDSSQQTVYKAKIVDFDSRRCWCLLCVSCLTLFMFIFIILTSSSTYGDYYFTPFGFFLTLLGTLLAALKTILTNIILVKQPSSPLPFSSDSTTHLLSADVPNQSSPPPSFFSSLSISIFNSSASNGPKSPALSSFTLPKLCLSPLHLLYLLSPLAFIQTTLLAHFTGELSRVHNHLFHSSSSMHPIGSSLNFRIWLVSNGILAFFLNVVSFHANRRVGPLAMSVAGKSSCYYLQCVSDSDFLLCSFS
jgi:hypothetical protein